jgi:hypothetical protein
MRGDGHAKPFSVCSEGRIDQCADAARFIRGSGLVTATRLAPQAAPSPLLRSRARRIVIRRSADLARFLDGLASDLQPAPVRIALLLEVAYRACVAAATLTAANKFAPADIAQLSDREEATRMLLAIGARFRVRCSVCGALYKEASGTSRARHRVTCRVGACAAATGWEISLPAAPASAGRPRHANSAP